MGHWIAAISEVDKIDALKMQFNVSNKDFVGMLKECTMHRVSE